LLCHFKFHQNFIHLKRFYLIAFYLLSQLTAMAQWNTDRIMDMGQNAMYFSDYVISIQYFNQVIAIKPYLAEPYLMRAHAKYFLGDFEGAEQDCTEAINRNPFVPRAYYIRGFLRNQLKFHKEAAIDFSKALEFSPNDTTFIRGRAEAYERDGNYTAALNDVNQLLHINPKSYGLLYEKGRYYLELKDTVEAEKAFDKFIDADKKSSLGWSARALLKMQKKDKDGALKDYNEAIKRNSTFAGDYINRGILNNEKKNYKQALSDYDHSIKLDSTENLGYYNRGFLRGFLGDSNNALADFERVLDMDSTNTEARLKKAILEYTTGKYKNAIADYKIIISKYSYYIPAYQGLAECEDKLGNAKNAFKYRQMAQNIEANKDYYKRKAKEILIAENKIATEKQKVGSGGNKRNLFNQNKAQNTTDNEPKSQYGNALWGNIQNKYADVTTEGNFVISHITLIDKIRRTNLFHPLIEKYNKENYPSSLRISNREIPLTSELLGAYFDAIKKTTDSISKIKPSADVYYARALQFASVQDYIGAIDDLDKALQLRPDFTIAYFTRANVRYRLLDAKKNEHKKVVDEEPGLFKNNQPVIENSNYKIDLAMIMQDLDKAAELTPDFSFTYFNKANISSANKDFKNAITLYTKSIEVDKEFAEAYFNRGLIYLFIGEDNKGLSDLSKAGELGIIKSYNLIQRFKN
jgi:tetratricopeptide (TPR) repeat protein